MPSGPKKRRAARRRRGQGGNHTGEDDEFDGAGELSAGVNNASEMSVGDEKVEAVNKTASKKSQPVDQIALESPPTVLPQNVEKSEDVPVENKGKNSEHESVHDQISKHAPVIESEITMKESSVSDGKKEKESESEPVDQVLDQPGLKETEGKDHDEVGEGTFQGPTEISVNHVTSVPEKVEEMSKEDVRQDPLEEPKVHSLHQSQAIVDTFDPPVPTESSVSKMTEETFIKDTQDSLTAPPGSSNLVDVSADHEELVQENEVGESESHGSPATEKDVSVVNEGEEVSIKGITEDLSEEPIGLPSDEVQATAKTVDQSILAGILSKEDQDFSVPVDSVSETNVDTSLEDGQESLIDVSPVEDAERSEFGKVGESEDHGTPAMVTDDASVVNKGEDISVEGVLEDSLEERSGGYSDEPQAMVKTLDEFVLKPIRTKKAQDPSIPAESDIEVDVQTLSLDDAQESFETPPGSPMTGYMSQVIPLSEAQDRHIATESINDVNVEKSLKEVQDSFKEPPESSSPVDVSLVEGVIQGYEVAKLGERDDSPHVDPVIKEDEDMSMESVLKEPLEQSLEHSAHEEVKTVDELVMEVIPLEEPQDPSVAAELVIEKIETDSKDAKDSFEGQERRLSLVQRNKCAVGKCTCDCALINLVVSKGEKISLKGEGEDPFEEPTGNTSNKAQEMVDTIDESVTKAVSLETQDPYVPPMSGTQVNVETSFKDAQISYNVPLGSPSRENLSGVEGLVEINAHGNEPNGLSSYEKHGDVISVEGVVPGNECAEASDNACLASPVMVNDVSDLKEDKDILIEGVLEEPSAHSSDELEEIVETFDQEIPLKEDEDPNIPAGSESEENVEISLEDGQEYSSKMLLGRSFLVKGNEYEVGESATLGNPFVLGMEDDEEMSVDEGALEEPFEELIKRSSHEPQELDKTVDQSVLKEGQEASVPGESVIKVNVETSLQETQDCLKQPQELVKDFFSPDENTVQGKECVEGHESSMAVDHVELVMEENEEMSIEGVLEEPSEELNEPGVSVKTVDQSVLKEGEYPSLPVETVIDVLHVEGVLQRNEIYDVGESKDDGSPVMIHDVVSVLKEDDETLIEGVHHDSFTDPNGDLLHEPQVVVKMVDELVLKELHLKDDHDPLITEEAFKTPLGSPSSGNLSPVEGFSQMSESIGDSSDEPWVMVKTVDQLDLNVIPLTGVQDSSISNESVIKENVETPLTDVKDFPIESFGSLSLVSSMEGIVQENENGEVGENAFDGPPVMVLMDEKEVPMEDDHALLGEKEGEKMSLEGVGNDPVEEPMEDSLLEPQEMVDRIDKSVMMATSFKETQDPKVPAVSVTEVNVETSFNDAQESSKESLGSPSLDKVTSISKNVDFDVSSDETQLEIVKTVDQVVLKKIHLEDHDIPLPGESVIEANVIETSSKEADILKGDVHGDRYDETDESACHGTPSMVNQYVSVLEDEEICAECVLEEHFKELNGLSSDELQVMIKTVDQVTQAKEVQDPSLPVESIVEENLETSLQYAEDSFKEPIGDSSMDNMSHIKVVQGNESPEVGESTCDDQPVVVKDVETVMKEDIMVMKEIHLKEDQDPFESATEVNVDTSVEDAQDSYQEIPSLSEVTFVSINVHFNDYEIEPTKCYSHDETQEMVQIADDCVILKAIHLEESQDDSLEDKSVIEENVEKDAQYSFKEPLRDSYMDDASPIEGFVQGNEYGEGGENGAMVNFVDLVMEDNEKMSTDGVLKELTESSSNDTEVKVNTIDQSTPIEAQDLPLPADSVIEMSIENSFKDDQDSLKEKPKIPLLDDVSLAHIGESAYHVESIPKEDSEMSMESNLQDPFEEPTKHSLHEPQETVKNDDQLVLKGLDLKEAQDPSVPADSIIKVNVDTSFEDAQESYETPLGRPSVRHGSLVGGFSRWIKPIGNYLPEPEAMVKIVDKVVSKLIPMEEEEDEVTSLTGESFLEENKETSLNDTKSHSSTEPLGSFSTADVSSIKGLVQGNESVEVGESTSDDQPAVVNYVESVIKEDKEMFMDSVREEPQLTVKTSDDLVMEAKSLEDVEDPSIPIESVNEVNVDTFFKDAPNEKLEGPSPAEVIHLGGAQDDMLQDKSIIEGNDATSLKDDQDYIKKTLGSTFPLDVSRVEGVLQEKEYDEADENEAMVNLVESVTKNNKEMSIEGVLEEVIRSSHDSKVMVNPVDQSTQKEAQDSSIPVESIIEENLETFFKDAPKEQQESPSPTKVIQLGEAQDDLLQDKSVIEENVVTSLKYAQDSFKETLGSTFLIDASPAECVVQEKEYDVDGKNGEIVNFVESVTKTNEEMSIEGDPGEPLEEVIRSSSNDSELTFEEAQVPSLPVKSITEASMKTSFKGDQDSWKETQYKSVPDASVIKVNVDTSFEDAQESFETPLGSPSVRHVSLVEGFTGWIKPIGQYLHTPEAMVRIVDQVVSKVIPMKETQETSLTVESVLEANKETSLNDTKAHSSTESLGSFSMADVSSIKGIVLGNECVEVGENACDDQPAVVNYVESVMKEDKEMSMKSVREEPQITVKTFDDLVMEAIPLKETENFSIPVESVIGVNVETFVKDAPIKQQESPSPAKVIHLGGAQDLQDKSIIEENDVRSLKYAQDSFKETLGSTFPVDVSRVEGFLQEKEYVEGGETIVNFVESVTKNNEEMSTQGVLEKVFKSYSHDSEVTVNPVDQSTLKEAQDPSLPVQSIVEENVETFFKDAPKEQLQSPSSAEVIHLGEAQDDLLQDKSVIEENVATSIIDDQDSFKETSSILVNVSPAEGVVQENEYDEDGQSRAILNFVESVTKDNEEMSIKGVHDESFEEVIRSSSHQSEVPLKEAEDPQTTVKMVDDLVMEAIPLKEAEDPSVPVELVIEVNVETSFKDVPKEKQESPSLAKVTFVSRNIHLNDYGIEPIEFSSHDETQSVVQTIDHVVLKVIRAGEAQDDLLRDNSVIKEDVLTSLKDAQDSFKETLGSTFLVDVSHVEGIVQEKEYDEGSKNGAIVNSVESATKNNEKMPIGVLEEPFEEVIRNSSHDLEVMVKTVDQSTLEDAQEYFGTPLGSPSVRHVSPVDQGFAEWDGTIKNSSRELHVIPMEETQEPSLLDEPVIEANKETSLKDAKDYSASESLGTFSMPDVSSMEAFVQGNEYAEVGEKAFEGPPLITNSGMSVLKDENEVSMEGDLTESFKEAIEPSSDELRAMTKTVDLLVQEPSVLGVLNEKECGENSTLVNQVKSLKNESEDLSMEGVLQESIGKPVGNSSYEQEAIKPSSDEDELRSMMKTVDLSVQDPSVPGIHNVKECGENATMVKVESLKKESEDLSIKGVLEESFEKPVGDSSHEQEEMENTVDRSILKAQDPTVPLVDTSFKDVQDSVPLERPSQLDVLPIEGFVQENEFDKVGESARHGSLVINNHGSSSVINGCHVCQRNAQSNEMVGLVRTLLEEIRRIRAFYEEGLRQTTQIDFHILQILEKFNSDEQI